MKKDSICGDKPTQLPEKFVEPRAKVDVVVQAKSYVGWPKQAWVS